MTTGEGSPRTAAFEDIDMLLIDSDDTVISDGTLRQLATHNVATVMTDYRHLPIGVYLPLEGHSLTAERTRQQAQTPRELHNHWWQQIIRQKIRNQAHFLPTPHHNKLLDYADTVEPGDPSNREGQAARLYWNHIYGHPIRRRGLPGTSGTRWNPALNYAYAITRARIARDIVTAGLHPAFGVSHCNARNYFALADDLIEPFRPLIDHSIFHNIGPADNEISPEMKRAILREHAETHADMNCRPTPLPIAINRFVTAYQQAITHQTPLDILPAVVS